MRHCLLTILLLAGAPASAQQPAWRAAADSAFSTFDRTSSPGCALGVVQRGDLVYARGYGMANLETRTPITPETAFYIASTSKQFTAAAVSLLASEGRLDLDAPLKRWFPELPAWADSVTLVLFVLGSPNTLQVADVRTGRADTAGTSIGRSLHRIPGQRLVSFVHKASRDEWWLATLDPYSRSVERMVRMPAGVEDYAWTPEGIAIAGDGSALKAYDPRRSDGWQTIADLSSSGLGEITRLAVSPSGDAIAIVAVPRP